MKATCNGRRSAPDNSGIILTCEGLRKSFANVQALEDGNIRLRRAEIMALVRNPARSLTSSSVPNRY